MSFKKDFSPIDLALHLHPGVPHCVLPWSGRDHPANVSGDPLAREIPAIHNDSRLAERLGHCMHCKRPFQVTKFYSRLMNPVRLPFFDCNYNKSQ